MGRGPRGAEEKEERDRPMIAKHVLGVAQRPGIHFLVATAGTGHGSLGG